MKISVLIITTLSLFLLISCGNGNETQQDSNQQTSESGLTDFELEHGIGPVTERVELGEIDPELVDEGRNIFSLKCEACHNMEGRMVGPALGDVLERRSAEFVMNMMLNPSGMTREHPEGQRMLQEYMTPMPFQNVSESDARAILEYLRDYSNN